MKKKCNHKWLLYHLWGCEKCHKITQKNPWWYQRRVTKRDKKVGLKEMKKLFDSCMSH